MTKTLKSGVLLQQRYKIIEKINHGGMGQTYKALDEKNNCEVAIKMLLFSQLTEWKTLDLFEREVNTLKSLNYPTIPDYIDDFKMEGKNEIAFFLVQEYVEGKNLYEWIEEQKRFTNEEVLDIFKSLLNTLDYIHNLKPAVIHRDIQPKNIILKNGQPYLLDFGSVGQIAMDTMMAGNTFIGTIGYFPHEQMMGKVSPSSDLYALAMTMIFILTGKHPVDLESIRGELNYRKFTNVDESFAKILDKLIATYPEDRYQNVKNVMMALNKNGSKEKPLQKVSNLNKDDIQNAKNIYKEPVSLSKEEEWEENIKKELFEKWMNTDDKDNFKTRHKQSFGGSLSIWEQKVKTSLFDEWFERKYNKLNPSYKLIKNPMLIGMITFFISLTLLLLLLGLFKEIFIYIIPISATIGGIIDYFSNREYEKLEEEFLSLFTNNEFNKMSNKNIRIKRYFFWLEKEKAKNT